jgi:Ca2+-binding RTX toxin-like protein
MSYPAIIQLSALTADLGFQINGTATNGFFGWSASGIGDYNGDGIEDFIVGARGVGGSGAAYVIYGKSGGFDPGFDLTDLDGTNGFAIQGEAGDFFGWAVAGGGDLNGDGRADLIVSAVGASPNGQFSGYGYVLFGGYTPAGGTVTTADFDGTNGFRVAGPEMNSFGGWSTELAGDINGDGLADLIFTAYASDINGGNSGTAWIVYGRTYGYPSTFNLSDINGANGFRVIGDAGNANLGFDVSSAGDVNGDGYEDLILGAPGKSAYVLFGGGALAATINVSSLNGTNGFEITAGAAYDRIGTAVSSAGDVNGDGFADIFIGAYGADTNGSGSGDSYVIFGKASGFTADLSVTALDGTNGFRIGGVGANDGSGKDLQYAGDINGDGFSDLIIGAHRADATGTDSGAAYVIFGKATGYTAAFNLAALNGTNGFRINGGTGLDRAGLMVSGIGDVNGDGLDDFIIGAPYTDIGFSNDGSAYIIYGQSEVRNFFGTAGADTFNGGALEDLIIGGGGADTLRGMGGADEISGGEGDDQLYGGDGDDTLTAGAGSDLIDGGTGADIMTGGAGNDTFFVDDSGDTASEGAGGGSDRVRATASFALGANIENLNLEGAGDINGTGNSLANQIHGNSGANLINAGGGADIVKGNQGADTLSGEAGADLINGGDGNDIIDGGADNDVLYGEAGDDTLRGGEGVDRLEGGLGADTLQGDAGADQLFGGDDNDILMGGADNDVLDGGAGTDSLQGGAGDDTYLVDGTDTISEALNEGNDIVRSTVSWTLGDNFERLFLLGSANLNGTGNGLANTLVGNSGQNLLDGGAGADILNGDGGIDTLIGGTGNDILSGGAGGDVFLFGQASVFLSSNPQGRGIETDAIGDFSTGDGDTIDLSAIDAIASTGADDAFTLISAFDGQAGRMTLTFAGGVTTLLLDVDGDRSADYRLRINGDVTGDSGGWAL